ncbi:MAG: hypothetical protein WKF94_16080 [Solirubrobacteraceae bacterium]
MVYVAQRIESLSFPPLRTGPYPLAEWMNGSTWEVVRGEDFEGTPQVMQAGLQ